MTVKNSNIAAIDIGTTKIVTVVGEVNERGRLNVKGMSRALSKGVDKGVVVNVQEVIDSIKTTVSELEEQIGDKIADVYVGIAGQHIKSIQTRGYVTIDREDDEITQDDIDRLVSDMYKIHLDPGEKIIHVLPQVYSVDNETSVKNPVGMSGKRLGANFHIVVGKQSSVRNINRCVERVGLDVNELILEPLASSRAILTDDEMEAGVALVDIGGGTTDIAVFYDGIIRHTAVVPFGGDIITKDIKEGCQILLRQAQQLKHEYGSALPQKSKENTVVEIEGIRGRDKKGIYVNTLASIIQARMEEILDAVYFELQNSGYINRLGAGVVITGGGAMLKNLTQMVRHYIGLDVRIGMPNEFLTADSLEEVNQPMFATSVGLLLKGYDIAQRNADDEDFNDQNEEIVTEDELETETVSVDDENQPKKKVKKFFGNIRDVFGGLFDEQDTKFE